MPAARAASSREAPSSTSARASISLAARASRHRPATRRSSTAPSSFRVTATVMAPLRRSATPPINARGPRMAPRAQRSEARALGIRRGGWHSGVGSIAKCESPTFAGVCPSETPLARTYRQLDLGERRTLFRLIEARTPVGAIAERLGRHPSTIHRELGRNRFRDGDRGFCGYFPLNAQDLARRRRQRRRKLAADEGLRTHVTERLSSTLHGQGGRQATSRRRSRRPAGIFVASG